MKITVSNCFTTISNHSLLLLQYPFCQKQDIRTQTLFRLKTEKHVHIIAFIHDVESLRKLFFDKSKKDDFDFTLQLADIFIVHNNKMLEYFTKLGIDRNNDV